MEIKALFDHIFTGEHNSDKLRLTVEPELAGLDLRLIFRAPDGNIFLSDIITAENGQAEYTVPGAVCETPGRLFAQAEAYDGSELVAKSRTYEFFVFPSADSGGNETETARGLITLGKLYDDFISHDHNGSYYLKAETDSLITAEEERSDGTYLSLEDAEDYLKKTEAAGTYARSEDWNAVTRSVIDSKTVIFIFDPENCSPDDLAGAISLTDQDRCIIMLKNADGIHALTFLTHEENGDRILGFDYVHENALRSIKYKAAAPEGAFTKTSDITSLPVLPALLSSTLEDYQTCIDSGNAGFGISIENGVISADTDDIFPVIDGALDKSKDWLENDPDSSAYVKNRTHYITREVFCPETELEGFTEVADGYTGISVLDNMIFPGTYAEMTERLRAGSSVLCDVTVDGFTFTEMPLTVFFESGSLCVEIDGDREGKSFWYTDRKYNADDTDPGFGQLWLAGFEGTSHTVTIVSSARVYVKLDNRYLDIDCEVTADGTKPVSSGAVAAALSEKQNGYLSAEITLNADDWDQSELTLTAAVPGVTDDCDVDISPAPDDHEAFCKAGVYGLSQADGSITFICHRIPETDLDVNLRIWG